MSEKFLEDLQKRGDLAVEGIRELLSELGLLVAYGDGDLIFADKKTFIETGKKVSVGTRIGNLNATVFKDKEHVPNHLLDNQERMDKRYKRYNNSSLK